MPVCARVRVCGVRLDPAGPQLPRNPPGPGRERFMCLCVCAREKGAVGEGVKETLVRRKGECARVCGAGVGGRGE